MARTVFAAVLSAFFIAIAAPAAACTPEPRSHWRPGWGVSTCAWLTATGGAVRGTVTIQDSWSRQIVDRLGARAPAFVRPYVDWTRRYYLSVEESWGVEAPRRIEIDPGTGGCIPEGPPWLADHEYLVFGRFAADRGPYMIADRNVVPWSEVPAVVETLGPGVSPSAVPRKLRVAVGRAGLLGLLLVFARWWFALGVRARVRGVRGH